MPIELGGKLILRVWAKHEPDPGHLRDVIEDMRELGAPIIRCVLWRGELYALEGSHRLRAAHELGVPPHIELVEPDRTGGDDEPFWERLHLTHYAWEAFAV